MAQQNKVTIASNGLRRRRATIAASRLLLCSELAQPSSSAMEPKALALRGSTRSVTDIHHPNGLPNNRSPGTALRTRPLPSVLHVSRGLRGERQLNQIVEEVKEIHPDDDDERDDYILSYEECLEISAALGDVKTDGWRLRAEGEINKLNIEIYNQQTSQDQKCDRLEESACLVCLQDYNTNDVLRRLPCGHNFHICCVDQWLYQSSACPCCRKSIDEDT